MRDKIEQVVFTILVALIVLIQGVMIYRALTRDASRQTQEDIVE